MFVVDLEKAAAVLDGMKSELSPHHLFQSTFYFIIHLSSHHLTLYNLSIEKASLNSPLENIL
jgi:hypothetical protein